MTLSNGQILVDDLFKIEAFQKAYTEIKIKTQGLVELNMNPKSKSTVYRQMFNDKTRKIVSKRFEKDINYFKYTF